MLHLLGGATVHVSNLVNYKKDGNNKDGNQTSG